MRSRLGGRRVLSGSVDQLPGCAECRPRVMLSQNPLAPSRRCALVGSSDSMNGRQLGAVLERTYDTIIRVNRVPAPEYFADFGRRTDVLFIRPVAHKRATFTRKGQAFTTLDGHEQTCSYSASHCLFKSVLLQGGDAGPSHIGSRHSANRFASIYPADKPGWKPWYSTFPIAHQSEELRSFTDWLLNVDSGSRWLKPSNGFHAFVYAAVVCDSVDLFGFVGNGTADHHRISWQHNLTLEHELIHKISKGQLNNKIRTRFPSCAPCMLRKMNGNAFHVY